MKCGNSHMKVGKFGEVLPRGLRLNKGRYELNIQRNGKRRFIALGTADRDVAIKLAVEKMNEIVVTECDGRTVTQLIPVFISDKQRDAGYSRATAEGMKYFLERFARWLGNLTPASINEAKVKAYRTFLLEEEGLTGPSVNSYLRAAGSFATWCVDNHLLMRKPPLHLLPWAKGHARNEFCTVEQRDKLIAEAPTPDLALVLHLGFFAGLRRTEVCEASPDWVDMQGGSITVKERPEKDGIPGFRIKDREQRTIPLHPRLKEFLKTWPLDGAYLLQPNVEHGASKYRYDIRAPFEDYMEDQKMPWVMQHTMRRTFASLLAQAGVSLYKIARWLGDTIETTEKHYAHLQSNDADIAPELRPPGGPSTEKAAAAPKRSGHKRHPAA